ncbi:arginase family protein [Aquabacterium sp. A7-Y]|uniref:arginase family protein n=1 Tax=Aquabacterium sp. A7-Y TaxID=1349605 RepID=UPI00223CC940|nr:arginase family protein [Aquabacterium sp. A7-Y]MCW7538068.1 arginase family protein [Aquabacterium sp. A7-Y]
MPDLAFDTAPLALTVHQGRAGDRNPRAMAGARRLGEALTRRLGLETRTVGEPQEPLGLGWRAELDAAHGSLRQLATHCDTALARGHRLLTVLNRCACALATLPAVARHWPDARIVWFDAHADSNTPETSSSGYLGGLVLTGAAGLWDSGLGAGLRLSQVVLVGARDIDPAEQALIDAGSLQFVPPGEDLVERLRAAVGAHPVYVHLDCDVLEPGIVPTEYQVPGGLSLEQLAAASKVLAAQELIGLEIAEFEANWPGSDLAAATDPLLDALAPLLQGLGDVQQHRLANAS